MEETFHRRKRSVWLSWWMDETQRSMIALHLLPKHTSREGDGTMSGLHELNVSLTKNGYFKVADVIAKHPRHEVLNKIRSTYAGINLDRAQIANMLSADPSTKELPEEWDEIRNYSKRAIDALVFISILFSHHTSHPRFMNSASTLAFITP
jgi:hypothetical protein